MRRTTLSGVTGRIPTMAEALGVAVNVVAVLQLATKIAHLSYSYARDVKNAPKSQKEYLQEVSALMEVLFRVERSIQDAETTELLPERPRALSDDTLVDCYNALSNLQYDLQKRRSRFLQPFHEKEWRAHIDMLHKYRSLFADFLASCILVTGNATYNKVSILDQKQDRSMLLTWLPASNVAVRQRPSPSPGTGSAFLEQEAVQQWIKRSSDFLWCYGPPGAGKSCLASLLIDHLLKSRVPPDCPVVSFFCDFSSQDQQNTLTILHHLLRGIIEQGTPKMLAALKEECKDPSKLQNVNDVAQLIAAAGLSHPIYFVLDALDELRDPTALLSHISAFVSSGINVLVTSRDLPHIRKKMKTAIHVEIGSSPEDLRLYVESRFRDSDFSDEIEEAPGLIDDVVSKSGNLFLLARLMLDEVLELSSVNQIRKAIAKPQPNLQQAFEATLQRIDSQSKARSSLARRLLGWISYAARRLTLEEILCAFSVEDEEEGVNPDNRPNPDILLRSCLGLVVVDKIDQTLGLVHTTAYEFFKGGILPENDTNSDMAQTCLQYLSKRHVSKSCDSAVELSQRLKELPLLEYAAKYWGCHISGRHNEAKLERPVMKLLCDTGLRSSAFQALQYRPELLNESVAVAEEIFQSMPTDQGEFHIAAFWGLTHTAEALLSAGVTVSSLDSHKWTPLHWACSRDHLPMVAFLLANGAEVNAQDIQGWTPLFWAAFRGNPEIVGLLLGHGANHLARSSLGWTALHWAVSSGHSDCVELILEHHAQSKPELPKFYQMGIDEVEAYAEGVFPLDIASDGNDADIFDLLVRHLQTPTGEVGDAQFNKIWSCSGFDRPVSINPWRTMTKAEQLNGREYVVPSLSGWKAGRPGGQRADPVTWKSVLLLSAIRDNQLSSVQLLIQAGADVQYGNALQIAACRKDPRYVQFLLKAGADPTRYDNAGRTALHEAVLNGFTDTIKALIDGGADVNQPMRDKTKAQNTWRRGMFNTLDGSTALIQACGFTFFNPNPDLAVKVASLLLSYGADAKLQDASGMTALHYAVMRPYPKLIKLLIDAGCPLDTAEEDGRMPIHILATCQEKRVSELDLQETVRLVLGPDQCGTSESRLNVPAIGRQGVRRRTMNLGDESNPTEEELSRGRTPIYIALKNKRWRVAGLFYKFGAKIPEDLELAPILAAAVEDLEASTVDLFLDHGVTPPESVVSTLVGALTKQPLTEDSPGGHYALFEHILQRIVQVGANIDHRLEDGDTPLITLISGSRVTGSLPAVREFVKLGADVLASSKRTFDPILTAALYGDEQMLHHLMESATKVDRPKHWSRHLAEAIHESASDIDRVCLSLQRADALDRVNSDGCTLLHLAAEFGNVLLVEGLLSCGARSDIEDEKGRLAVHCAGFAQQTEALRALLSVAAAQERQDTSKLDRQFWLEALKKPDPIGAILLNGAVRGNNVPMVDYLLAYGMDPNTTLTNGWNKGPILNEAAYNGHRELVSTILSHGANVSETDKYGWNALHNACYAGHTDIALALMAAGADVHSATVQWNNSGYKPSGIYESNPWPGQPLHLATMAGNADLVKILLDKGVDTSASTYCGQEYFDTPSQGPTALHLALDTGTFYARKGLALDENRLTIAQWLVERGEMVQGVISKFKMRDVLKFKEFPDLWHALREGEQAGQDNPVASA
ncbi:ankyrin repeat-containing domain protein [Aspergillus granulosus]|uniref:Ankyrin repeat-containing domain protein n=1 Tax=Aspergillus granulosus TaxID=176169 RepID=A0ABR4HNJ7_9EURO